MNRKESDDTSMENFGGDYLKIFRKYITSEISSAIAKGQQSIKFYKLYDQEFRGQATLKEIQEYLYALCKSKDYSISGTILEQHQQLYGPNANVYADSVPVVISWESRNY